MNPFARDRRIRRTRKGTYVLSLHEDERALLAALPGQLRVLLETPEDPTLRRLTPPAYVNDRENEVEYRRLMGDDLLQSRLEALEVLESTAVESEELDEAQLTGWMRAINDLRLVIGTKLDVSEDDDLSSLSEDDPDIGLWAVYHYLGVLQEDVVQAMASGL